MNLNRIPGFRRIAQFAAVVTRGDRPGASDPVEWVRTDHLAGRPHGARAVRFACSRALRRNGFQESIWGVRRQPLCGAGS